MMSTSDIENSAPTDNINIMSAGKRVKSKLASPSVLSERRTLKTIQASSDDENKLTRNIEKPKDMKKETRIMPSHKPVQVFVDPVSPVPAKTKQSLEGSTECSCSCHQQTEEDKMLAFMTEEPSINDWKNLAEERRQALEESLVENRQLHFEVVDYKSQVTSLTQEVEELRQETRRLSQQRDYFANILQDLVSEDASDSGATTSDNIQTSASSEEDASDESAIFTEKSDSISP